MARHPHALVHPFRITLVAFIDDLQSLEESGLNPNQCEAVLKCLDTVLEHLKSAKGAGVWLQELLSPFGSLRAEYYSWNFPHDGADEPSHRAKQCKRIRKQKDGLLPRFRFGPLFATDLEQKVFLAVYDAFVKLDHIEAIDAQPGKPFKKTAKRAGEKRAALAKQAA